MQLNEIVIIFCKFFAYGFTLWLLFIALLAIFNPKKISKSIEIKIWDVIIVILYCATVYITIETFGK